ncbi:MAG: hypothetical protein AB8G22_19515 [Saprospiraceae bacterium]
MNHYDYHTETEVTDDVTLIQPWMVWAVIVTCILGIIGTTFFGYHYSVHQAEKEELQEQINNLQLKLQSTTDTKVSNKLVPLSKIPAPTFTPVEANEMIVQQSEINTKTKIKEISATLFPTNQSAKYKDAVNKKIPPNRTNIPKPKVVNLPASEQQNLIAQKDKLTQQATQLERKIERLIKKNTPASKRSLARYIGNFQIKTFDKQFTLTNKAKKVRHFSASIEISKLPITLRTTKSLYLVATNANAHKWFIPATDITNEQIAFDNFIIAAQTPKLNLSQILQFKFTCEKKLPAGDYEFALYDEAQRLRTTVVSVY